MITRISVRLVIEEKEGVGGLRNYMHEALFNYVGHLLIFVQ
jgi:hypothetical protein